jgi:hypothetical protein
MADNQALLFDINRRLKNLEETLKQTAGLVHGVSSEVAELKGLTAAVAGLPAASQEGDDIVDPWTVQGASDKGVDYEKLIGKSTINR